MNVVLWVLQVLLAFLAGAGGAFKAFAFKADPSIPSMQAFSRGMWAALGVFEMLCAVLLIVPGATHWMLNLTVLAAAALALESLALAAVYARYSRAVTASNPLVYVVPMAVIALLVAWGRWALSPLR
ncbi:MAG TPA: DoxX family protein [Gemmatimonadales bacterium]|jgi:hypothetical protein